ncbi:MAG: hypothetical protein VX589_07410 [Myxococcota bacterium]|nr:hypothetical protein [Myxococcota bacterium]
MSSLFLTLLSAFGLSMALVLWRVWPALRGRLRDTDSVSTRVAKWNRYMAPLFRKHLGEDILVARANVFHSPSSERPQTIATWSLAPTVIPAVDFVALMVVHENSGPTLAGFIALESLRAVLPNHMQSQGLFGHTAWVCVWPDSEGLEVLDKHLMASESFRAHHGLVEIDKGENHD